MITILKLTLVSRRFKQAAEFQSLIHTLTSERDEATALLEDERTVSDEVQQVLNNKVATPMPIYITHLVFFAKLSCVQEMKSDLERAQRLHTSTDQQLTTVQQELNTLTTIYQVLRNAGRGLLCY